MQQLTDMEVKQVSGGMLDGEVLFIAAAGVLGAAMGVYSAPMIAPNAAVQVMMVMPLSITGGALLGMAAAGVMLAMVY